MRGSTTASRMPIAITPPENPTGPPISGSERTASRVACHSGTALSTSGRMRASTISSTGSPTSSALRRSARACSAAAERGRSPLPGSSMATEATLFSAAWRARPASRGVHLVQSPGVPDQDQRCWCGCGRPKDAWNLAEGESAFEDAAVEALFRSEVHGRAFRGVLLDGAPGRPIARPWPLRGAPLSIRSPVPPPRSLHGRQKTSNRPGPVASYRRDIALMGSVRPCRRAALVAHFDEGDADVVDVP